MEALLRSLALNLFSAIILATYLVWIMTTSWLLPALIIPPFPTLNDLCWGIFPVTLSEDFLFSVFLQTPVISLPFPLTIDLVIHLYNILLLDIML